MSETTVQYRPPNKLFLYEAWRLALAQLQGGRPLFRDQVPESMQALAEIVRDHEPEVIVEIGTNYGLSTRVFLEESKAPIHCIDITFNPWRASLEVLPVKGQDRLILHEQDVTSVALDRLVMGKHSLVFFDCHGPVPIAHTLKYVDAMMPGSVMVIDDVWRSDEQLTEETWKAFYDEVVLPCVDGNAPWPLHPQDYAYDPAIGTLYGFSEVVPIMKWLVQQAVIPNHTPPKTLWFMV